MLTVLGLCSRRFAPASPFSRLSSSSSTAAEDKGPDRRQRDQMKFDPHLWRRANERAAEANSGKSFSSLNPAEVDKFRAMASEWWDPAGKCAPLHSMNALRVTLVREGLENTGRVTDNVLKGDSILQYLSRLPRRVELIKNSVCLRVYEGPVSNSMPDP